MATNFEDYFPPGNTTASYIPGAGSNQKAQGTLGTISTSSAWAFSTTASFSGAITPTGGIAPLAPITGNNYAWTLDLNPGAGTTGNNTSMVAGSIYWAQVFNKGNASATGIAVLIGTTGGTDSWNVAVYTTAGTLSANSVLTGTAVGATGNVVQKIPFTAAFSATGPHWYIIALQSNGTTATFQSHTLAGQPGITGSTTGVFGTLAAITPGTTYTNNVGPIAAFY